MRSKMHKLAKKANNVAMLSESPDISYTILHMAPIISVLLAPRSLISQNNSSKTIPIQNVTK